MANRIISGNVALIDTSTSNIPFLQGNIVMVGFYGVDTTSKMVLTLASDTTNSLIAFASGAQGSQSWADRSSLGGPWYINDTMYCLTLVSGTGWIYYA